MKRSPKLKPTKWDALVVLTVLLLALGLGARPYFAAKSAGFFARDAMNVIKSVSDGETVERCALSNYEGGTYESRGYTLTVAVENGAVRVSESDCPNQDCVHSGAISRAGQSIVCLPARVAVTLEGAASDYDLIAG